MRKMVIQFDGDDWDDEDEADDVASVVCKALDRAEIDYMDVFPE